MQRMFFCAPATFMSIWDRSLNLLFKVWDKIDIFI